MGHRQRATIYTTLTGGPLNLTDADNTVALKVSRQGKCFLFFTTCPRGSVAACSTLGDDGSYTSGSYDFTASSGLAWSVLARDLDDTARWYGHRVFKALFLGNGVNDNVIAQLGPQCTPGVWRKGSLERGTECARDQPSSRRRAPPTRRPMCPSPAPAARC